MNLPPPPNKTSWRRPWKIQQQRKAGQASEYFSELSFVFVSFGRRRQSPVFFQWSKFRQTSIVCQQKGGYDGICIKCNIKYFMQNDTVWVEHAMLRAGNNGNKYCISNSCSTSIPFSLFLPPSHRQLAPSLSNGHRCSKPAALAMTRRPARRIKDAARAELTS